MTQNQIAYHNAKELARHNLATEQENVRHQKQQELLQQQANELQDFANRATKEHYERMDAINATHYNNADTLALAQLAEQSRANLVNEQLKGQQNAINAAAVYETQRHNEISEMLQKNLNDSTIYKNMAAGSLDYSNSAYTQEKINTENLNQGLIINQINELGTQAARNIAQAGLTEAQTYTETFRPANVQADTFNKTTSGYRNVTDAANNFFEGVGKISDAVGKIAIAVGAP